MTHGQFVTNVQHVNTQLNIDQKDYCQFFIEKLIALFTYLSYMNVVDMEMMD